MARSKAMERAGASLRAIAMSYPGAHEDFPWGESAFKVNGKVFLFMHAGDEGIGTSTKLPVSGAVALMLPFAEPTRYGLGKSGWVSARFALDDDVPIDLLGAWIDESYRAVAPKKLVASLPAAGETDKSASSTKKPAAKKTLAAAKKPAAAAKAPVKKPVTAKKPAVRRRPAA